MSSLHLVTDPPDASQPDLSCSFCNKPRADVGWLVTGPERRAICDECITLAAEVIATRRGDPPPVPPDLDAVLARELVGQDAAARALSTLVARTRAGTDRAPVALLVGPPGTGKSHAAGLLVRDGGLPAVHAHCSRLSAVGYVGEQIGNLVLDLGETAGAPVTAGIVVFDGVDGLAEAGLPRTDREVSTEEVQLELVTLLDDSPVSLPRLPAQPVEVRRLLRVLVATLDPLPPDDQGVRDALAAAGVLDGVLARIDVIVPFPRRDAAALAPLVADLPLTDDGRDALLAAAAASDGAWVLQAVAADVLAHGITEPLDAEALRERGLA